MTNGREYSEKEIAELKERVKVIGLLDIYKAQKAKIQLEEKILKTNPFKEEEVPKTEDVKYYKSLILMWEKLDTVERVILELDK